jgi:hypothetical protein
VSGEIATFDQLERMSVVLGAKKLFGMTPDELLPLMLIARAEGKDPTTAAMEYDIIQGKPALRSRAALSRFQAAGGTIAWGKRDAESVTAAFSHPQGGELTITWTMERAKRAGLAGKDNWTKYPEAMLSARVIAEGVRAVYPGCLSGMYTDDERRDFADLPERNVTGSAPEEPAEPPAPEEEPPILVLRDPQTARINLANLAQDPYLPEAGKAQIAEALGDPETPDGKIVELTERAEVAIEKAKKAGKK